MQRTVASVLPVKICLLSLWVMGACYIKQEIRPHRKIVRLGFPARLPFEARSGLFSFLFSCACSMRQDGSSYQPGGSECVRIGRH